MSLGDHLRELRYRVIVSTIALTVATIAAAYFNNLWFKFLLDPFLRGARMLSAEHAGAQVQAVQMGVGAPFTLWLKLALVVGLLVSSPIWLYQIWAFLAPGLLSAEKRYAVIFVAVATPLFLAGVVVGYWVMPQGVAVLLSFTPDAVPITNLVDLPHFLDFLVKTMLVFGVSFLLPVFVVGLNAVGVLSVETLSKTRSYIIFLLFVFAAAATPSTDPFSMLALAIPMMLLHLLAELICRVRERRLRRRQETA